MAVFSHLTLILLSQVLQNLGKEKFPSLSFEQVGTRIAKVLEKVLHCVCSKNLTTIVVTCSLKVAFSWVKKLSFYNINEMVIRNKNIVKWH